MIENPEIGPTLQGNAGGEHQKSVELEHAYTRDISQKILGLNSTIYQYVKYIADRRLERISLPKRYNEANRSRG